MANKYAVRTITCKGCGETVTKRLRPTQEFCSHHCYSSSPKPSRRTGKEVPCELCGEAVYIPAGRLSKASNYFCSLSHLNEWQGRNKTNHTCEICGNAFKWSPSRQEKNNIHYCSIACRDKDPKRREMLLSMCANQRIRKPNANELRGYALLDAVGVAYEKEVPLAGKFIVDALLVNIPVVIQFDGDYWHGNPVKYPTPDVRQAKRMRLDLSQDAYLSKCGYRIVRLWESTIRDCPDEAIAIILAALIPS